MKTAIYLRQSIDRDQTKLAVDRQREDLLKLCAARGWGDPVEYCDNNVSANTGRRIAYQELCDDIRGGVIDRVAVWDLDRLHRQPAELEAFITLADQHHVELASVGGDADLSTASGRLFARMKGTVARYETEHKSARQPAANQQRAKSGKTWHQRMFGYDGTEVVEHRGRRDPPGMHRGAQRSVDRQYRHPMERRRAADHPQRHLVPHHGEAGVDPAAQRGAADLPRRGPRKTSKPHGRPSSSAMCGRRCAPC
jgi:DNA invertase Pin-like site-specific DNA recombinase